jgi:hypothetical protein
MNSHDGKVTWKVSFPFSLMCILFLVTFITPVHAAVGDLILDSEILLRTPDFHDAKKDTGSTTLLKDGYSLSLDKVWWGGQIGVANFSIFENGEVVKRLSANEEDYFYYNKTIDGEEYTIIKSRVDVILWGNYHLVKLRPVRQYSDGSVINEPDFITASLNPYTNETPPEEWNVTFGELYDDNGHSVVQTRDGGYILGGVVRSYNNQGSVRLVKTDSCGNITWHTTMDTLSVDYDYVMSVRQTMDEGYILAGFSNWKYVWLIKTDKNGSEQWKERFAVPDADRECSIWQTDDGGYMLLDGTKQGLTSSTDAWIIKTYANGKQEWNKKFKSDCFERVSSIEQTPDGGYLFAGIKGSPYSYNSYNACLVKTDANGIEQWNRMFEPDLIVSISSICQALDGGYVLAGKIDTAKNPEFKGQIRYENYDAWLFKIDVDGNLEWSKTFGGLKNDEASFVQQTSDGGYIIAGTTESYGAGGSDLWLVKVAGMETDFVQPNVTANNISIEEVRGTPEKPIQGFGFWAAVVSVVIVLFQKRKTLGGGVNFK